jgi:hypothetical protein
MPNGFGRPANAYDGATLPPISQQFSPSSRQSFGWDQHASPPALPPPTPAPTQQPPKPKPIFGRGLDDDDEKENIPEIPTVVNVPSNVCKLAKGPKRGSAASVGKRGGRGGGMDVRRGPAKRKAAYEDEESNEEVPVKRGRVVGAGKWRDEDFATLLDLAEELLPAGKREWLALYARFAEWATEKGRPVRSADTIEKRFKTVRYHFYASQRVLITQES